MPASHTNGQPFYLSRHPTNLASPSKAVLSLTSRPQEPEHLSHERLLSPLSEQLRQLKSRHPFAPAALELLKDPTQSGISVAR